MTILVVGNGMVGHRFVEAAVERGLLATHRIVVVGEERRRAYDRVHLSTLFDGAGADDLLLGDGRIYETNGVELITGDPVVALDSSARRATTGAGLVIDYDACVLATGSFPFVPPIPGSDAPGSFVYRTVDDLDAIRDWAARARRGVVVGGGLLGLEAANALRLLGLDTTVVEFAPRLMAVQLDDGGGRALRRHVESLGIEDVDRARVAEAIHGVWLSGMRLWTWVQDDAVAALARIAQYRRVGIVSNADGTVERDLGRFGVCQIGDGAGTSVEVIVDSTVVGVSKPNPEIFRFALEPMNLRPEQVLYVGDAYRYDVVGASRAGLQALHFDPYELCPDRDDHAHVAALEALVEDEAAHGQ